MSGPAEQRHGAADHVRQRICIPGGTSIFPGPLQWFQDASLFKFIQLTERVTLRFNVDFFNVFNHPNNPTGVGGDGILATRNSGSGARLTQLACG